MTQTTQPERFRTPKRTAMSAAISAATLATALLLTGCASIDFDQALLDSQQSTAAFSSNKLQLNRSAEHRANAQRLAQSLLADTLTADAAVQLALANSPAVQAMLAQSWADMASAQQAGRIANPVFAFERITFKDELELGRLLSFGLLDLLTLPRRQAIAQSRIAQSQVQLSMAVVEQVTRVRQAWVRAVAASQVLHYAGQIQTAAEASAALAKRMQAVGNFSKLQRARQQVFYADSTAQLAAAQLNALNAREELIGQLGLTGAQAAQLKLPERLPDLPANARPASELTSTAASQRLDVQLARSQLEAAGQAQGLNLITSLVDVEVGVRRDTVFDNGSGLAAAKRGYELSLRLPIFDWGNAQRDAMNAQSLAAAHRYEAAVRSAASQLRQSYLAYRTAYDVARHYRDEVVPLRQTMADENLLRYNGMLIGVFELLADTREQIVSVSAAINAQQQFWLADAALSAAITGKPSGAITPAPPNAAAGSDKPGH